MALAKKCDRCGILYEHYPKTNCLVYNALRVIQKNIIGETLSSNKEYDLCPKCMEEFLMFIGETNNE